MSKPPLSLVVFPDLLTWEKETFLSLDKCLSQSFDVKRIEVSSSRARPSIEKGAAWLLSHHWPRAMRSIRAPSDTPIFVSVLSMKQSTPFLPSLFWKRWNRRLPPTTKLVAHSPLSFRFLREIEGLGNEQLCELPLPFLAVPPPAPAGATIQVATFGRFTSESNLNYFLTVAHYVARRASNIRFSVVGAGPLGVHISRMTKELGLSEFVSISSELAESPDIVLFHPLQNQHFLPLLFAASRAVPVIANETPGIETFLQDAKEGFLVPVNETKPMAELILRMAGDPIVRRAMGERLRTKVEQSFGNETLAARYRELVSPSEAPSQLRAA